MFGYTQRIQAVLEKIKLEYDITNDKLIVRDKVYSEVILTIPNASTVVPAEGLEEIDAWVVTYRLRDLEYSLIRHIHVDQLSFAESRRRALDTLKVRY